MEVVTQALEAAGCPLRGSSARCPAHDDRSPSLSVSEGEGGKVLLHCQAGCPIDSVLSALKLNAVDLFPSTNGQHGTPRAEVVARYPYTDENDLLLYTVERYEPGFDGAAKSFVQRPASGKKGKGSMEGVRLVLYRLPKVRQAVADGTTIYVVEGEKDVEALERAGCVATCNPMGAGKWKRVFDAEWALNGAQQIIVVADKDEAGLRHAREVAASLQGATESLIVVEPALGKDAADHLGAGLGVMDFYLLAGVQGAPTLEDWLAEAPPAEASPTEGAEDSWTPIDLGPILAGEVAQPTPDLLIRHDGTALIYERAVNGLHGDSGAGKGWLVVHAIRQQARRGRATILIDLEDVASSITARLIEAGMTSEEITEHLIYIRPQTPFDKAVVDGLLALIAARNVGLVVIDSLGEAFALEGLDENKDVEVGPWYRKVARILADAGPAVLLIDHSTKANDNPLHPSGSKRKRAAITGASYLVEAMVPFVKEKGGRLRLICAKDRHGNYRRGENVGNVVMVCRPFGTAVELTIYAPSPSEIGVDLPVILAAREAVRLVRKAGQPMSARSLLAEMTIKAGTATKRAGLELAVGRGALSESSGPRNARLLTYETDLPEEADP